jgi:hypothetical protein
MTHSPEHTSLKGFTVFFLLLYLFFHLPEPISDPESCIFHNRDPFLDME